MNKAPRFPLVFLIAFVAMLSACIGSTRAENTPIAIWGPKRVLPVRLSEGYSMARSSPDSIFEPISAEQSFSSGDEIQTGHDGRVVLELFHEGVMVLGANTHVKIDSLEGTENQNVYHLSLMGGEVFIVDGATEPPDSLDGLATSPAIIFDIETSDGELTLLLPALERVGKAGRLASVSHDSQTGDITITCFQGECSLSYGDEQTDIPEGELAILKRLDEASPRLFMKKWKWSRDNGSLVRALEFAGVEPFHFDALGLQTSFYATVHKVEGLVEAGLDSDHAAVVGGELLGNGHSLHTDATSRAALHFADGAVLVVGEHSTVHLGDATASPGNVQWSMGMESGSTVHLGDGTVSPGTHSGHFLLESGELYLLHTGMNPTTGEWVIDLSNDVAIVAQPNPDDFHMGIHVSYDPQSDDLVVTLLHGQAILTAGDQAVELPVGKRSEIKDSHDRYANIEINMSIGDMDDSEQEAWQSTLILSEVDPELFKILGSH